MARKYEDVSYQLDDLSESSYKSRSPEPLPDKRSTRAKIVSINDDGKRSSHQK